MALEQTPARPRSFARTILRSLIIDTVIREEATKFGLEATPAEIPAQVATDAQQAGGTSALKTELAGAGGSIAQLEDEITSDLNEQRVEDIFAQQRAVQVEQILATRRELQTTAKTYSDDTGTNAKGGDLGVLTTDQLSPPTIPPSCRCRRRWRSARTRRRRSTTPAATTS